MDEAPGLTAGQVTSARCATCAYTSSRVPRFRCTHSDSFALAQWSTCATKHSPSHRPTKVRAELARSHI